MCIYVLYLYRNCIQDHNLGWGDYGGRPFRIRQCVLNRMANDDIKDGHISKYRERDHALPCEGDETRIYNVDQPCHKCNHTKAKAREKGWPLNTDYSLPAAHIHRWNIPYIRAKADFREVSYTRPKPLVDEEEPVSPKSLSHNTFYAPTVAVMANADHASPRTANPSDAPTTRNNSNSSLLALRLKSLRLDNIQ